MCGSFCNDLFNACHGDQTSAELDVYSAYDTPLEFCTALFAGISNSESSVKVFVDQRNRECWNDVPLCTPDSFYRIYTECVGNRRNMIWAKKPEADCKGGFDQPPNQRNVPCGTSWPCGLMRGGN